MIAQHFQRFRTTAVASVVAAMGVSAGLSLLAATAGALLPSRERLGVPAVAES